MGNLQGDTSLLCTKLDRRNRKNVHRQRVNPSFTRHETGPGKIMSLLFLRFESRVKYLQKNIDKWQLFVA